MKKILLGILLMTAFANSAITQKSIVGNWTLAQLRTADPNVIVSIEKDTLNIMEKDWKFTEVTIYNVNYPGYGAKKTNLKYKLKVSLEGDYRIESDALKKYHKSFESEVLEGASDAEVAQTSLKEIEKMIKDELRSAAPILRAGETEMELQGINGSPNLKYTKPKMLPNSKLTSKQVPFFAPEGWRYPESAKELANFPVRLKNDKNLLTIVEADFNGDGSQDAVAYLMNEQTGQIALFLNLSQPDGSYSLEPYGSAEKGMVIENGIFLAPAGEYTNVSNKQKITTANDGFMIIIFDTAANLIYWNSNNWVTVPIGKKF